MGDPRIAHQLAHPELIRSLLPFGAGATNAVAITLPGAIFTANLTGNAVAAMVSMQGNDPAAPFGAAGRVRPKPPYDFPQAAPRR